MPHTVGNGIAKAELDPPMCSHVPCVGCQVPEALQIANTGPMKPPSHLASQVVPGRAVLLQAKAPLAGLAGLPEHAAKTTQTGNGDSAESKVAKHAR